MKIITKTLMAMSLSGVFFSAHANNPLHTFVDAGVTIEQTDNVLGIKPDANRFVIKHSVRNAFIAGMLIPVPRVAYPSNDEIADQLLYRVYKPDSFSIYSVTDVKTELHNTTVTARRYLLDTDENGCEIMQVVNAGEPWYMMTQVVLIGVKENQCEQVKQKLIDINIDVSASIHPATL